MVIARLDDLGGHACQNNLETELKASISKIFSFMYFCFWIYSHVIICIFNGCFCIKDMIVLTSLSLLSIFCGGHFRHCSYR